MSEQSDRKASLSRNSKVRILQKRPGARLTVSDLMFQIFDGDYPISRPCDEPYKAWQDAEMFIENA